MPQLSRNNLLKTGVNSALDIKRRDFLAGQLDLSGWRQLFGKVSKDKPDILVGLARKMPRIQQLLTRSRVQLPRDLSFVADTALDYLDNSRVQGKTVAVLDDSLNVGTSMRKACERLKKKGAKCVQGYALYARENFDPVLLDGYADTLSIGGDDELPRHMFWLPENTYRKKAASLARGLLVLNRPFDADFPVFTFDRISDTAFHRLEKRLALELGNSVWTLPSLDLARLGFARYTAKIENSHSFNCNLRFYADYSNSKIYVSPIIHDPGRNGIYATRQKLYEMALMACYAQSPLFRRLKLGAPRLVREEMELCFGPQYTRDNFSVYSDPDFVASKLSDKLPRPDFFLAALNCVLDFEDRMATNVHPHNLEETLIFFFKLLGGLVGEDQPRAISGDLLRGLPEDVRLDIESDDYLRLALGPTFGELVELIRKFWSNAADFSESELESELSCVLDQQIDHGFIVPVTSPWGQRIFRKGEPAPWSEGELFALGMLGRTAEPGDNLQEIMDDLTPIERGKYDSQLNNLA